MRVRELLDVPALKLRLLTDVTGLDRQIKHVYTTDLPDPGRYLTPGDLVLTGMIWCREPGDADRFVRALARAGASALAAGEALGSVPSEVVDACGRHGVALLAVPAETSFASVTDEVARRLSGDRASAMTRVLGRRRRLLSAVAEGAGLDEMFRLMGREIGVDCWLLTGTGRLVGGTGPEPPAELALRLAAEYVRADRLPAVVRDEESRYSLFGVGVGTGGEPRIASWFLACPGLEQDCPHEVRESVIELAADVALERARLEAGRSGERKLAEAIVALLADEGVAPAEVASLLRASGCAPDASYVVAAFAASPDRVVPDRMAGERVPGDRMAGERMAGERVAPDRWRYDLAEELAQPSRALAAALGEEVIVLIPVAGDPAASALAFTERLRAVSQVVEVDRSRPRISVGVAAPATGAAALAGAMHEASSARRLASLRAGAAPGMLVVTSDEVASHELLLASVPGSVLRSFRDRLLGPLLWYDTQHRAELVPTLREFLACSGSWNACAARMYVHVNTVRYRIKRIEELTGRDLSSLDDRVDFFLALRIRLPGYYRNRGRPRAGRPAAELLVPVITSGDAVEGLRLPPRRRRPSHGRDLITIAIR